MTAPVSKGYWVYIAELESGALYVGLTCDLIRRTDEHLHGKGGGGTSRISRLSCASSTRSGILTGIPPARGNDKSRDGRERRSWRSPVAILKN